MKSFMTEINSLLVALFLCSTCISVVLPSDGIVVLTNIVLFCVVLVLNVKSYLKKGEYKNSFIMAAILFVLFLINMLFTSEKQLTEYFLHFLCFGLPTLFFPLMNVDYGKVIKNVAILSILLLPFFLTHDYGFSAVDGESDSDAGELMTASYRVLPLICSLLLMFISEEKKTYKVILLVCVIIYVAFLSVIGSRGAILSVMVFFALLFISRTKSKTGRITQSGVMVMFTLVLVTQFDKVIEWLYNRTEAFGLNLLAISRLYYKVTQGDNMDSGRSELISKAMQDFNDSPLWGMGIASFDNYSGYPHNLFVQMLQEGGLLLFIPCAIIFFLGLKELILGDRRTTFYRILLFAFCGGVMQLMFSSYYWTSSLFWFFVFLILHKHTILKNN